MESLVRNKMSIIKNKNSKKPLNVLVIGGSGPVGYEISNYLISKEYNVDITYLTKKILNFKSHQLDVVNKDGTINLIKKLNPNLVIHCVALSGVDLAETNHKLSNSVTVDGTKNIILGCVEINCKIIYISTTYVYNENIPINTEKDIPSPKTYYGKSKLEAEKLIQNSTLDYLILRIDQAYGWTKPGQKTNSVIRVLDSLTKGKNFKEIEDWYNVSTFLPDIAYATEKLIQQNETGIYNLTGSDFVSRLDWSILIAEIFNLDKKLIIPIKSDSLNLIAKTPKINASNEKLFQTINFRMSGIKEGALTMLKTQNKIK
jgi:dTDP-4-dehydrorhamnose reductase